MATPGPGYPPCLLLVCGLGENYIMSLFGLPDFYVCRNIIITTHNALFWAATQTVAEVVSQFLQGGKLHLYVVIYKKDSPPIA